ncbi:hypothetical protein SKAU_G00207550 [Synaphobranchus kaupii]|uniref:Uncharacterized protein n=1 Tax=Synaphobranchus kaupii TaxID=118154 RepID=A0A9Q1F8P5_SYNKA|nr:hypothetical protein SKAU_G00207550 [Synaphobranchus kaupii]
MDDNDAGPSLQTLNKALFNEAGSAPLWDDGVVRERLAHYQQATEKARSELAALQAKHQSIQAQVATILFLHTQSTHFSSI